MEIKHVKYGVIFTREKRYAIFAKRKVYFDLKNQYFSLHRIRQFSWYSLIYFVLTCYV